MNIFICFAIVIALFAIVFYRNKAKREDEQARLNYERYCFEKQRNQEQSFQIERAGCRRAAEHEWSNKEGAR